MRGENLVPLFPETTESWLLLYLCGMWTLFICNPFWPKTAKCVFFRIYSTTSLVANLNMLYLLSWLHIILELLMCVLVAQLCPTLCDPTDCSSAGSSVHGILQAGILEWVTITFSTLSLDQLLVTNKPFILGLSLCRGFCMCPFEHQSCHSLL